MDVSGVLAIWIEDDGREEVGYMVIFNSNVPKPWHPLVRSLCWLWAAGR